MRGLAAASILALGTAVAAAAAQVAAPKTKIQAPALTAPVMDEAGLLREGTVARLNRSLRSFRAAGGAQIQVLTLPSLDGLPIEQASIQIVEQWKLGGAAKDDGVLLLVAKAERRARIEVGQGLEGNIPDAIAKRIVSDAVTPRFKQGDFDGGVFAGALQLARFANPEMDAASYFEDRGFAPPVDRDAPWPAHRVFMILLVILIVFFFIGGGRGRRFRGGGWGPGGFGGWGGGFGGGGWGGGFGGGGWGGGGGGGGGSWGGGGGGFSGGGASGDW